MQRIFIFSFSFAIWRKSSDAYKSRCISSFAAILPSSFFTSQTAPPTFLPSFSNFVSPPLPSPFHCFFSLSSSMPASAEDVDADLFFAPFYHGFQTRLEADALLRPNNGSFLVRLAPTMDEERVNLVFFNNVTLIYCFVPF